MNIQAAPYPFAISTVVLTVHDLGAVRRFYEQVVGLHKLEASHSVVLLGAGGRPLLELREDRHADRRSPREAGLFHTAFLLPSRSDLGRWAIQAARNRIPVQGASDHAVSEALYLTDPEGNGVEIYRDRSADQWVWSGGAVALTTKPLDIESLMRDASPEQWRGVPPGTIIGHVHLQVGAISSAEAFYAGVLGVPVTARYPGGTFYGAGGYHHHFATNIWNSRGAGLRGGRICGLTDIRLTADMALIEAVRVRGADAGCTIDLTTSGLRLRDPWGTALTLARADP